MKNYHKDGNSIQPRNSENINILTYNVWGLPIYLPKVGINPRFDKIADKLLNDNYDVICLQECFSERFRKKILAKLDQSYHYTQDYNKSRSSFLGLKTDTYGGLMTFSKFPIVKEEFYPFPEFNGMKKTERIGQKGFMVTQVINQKGDTVNILNTHLYAGPTYEDETFRKAQIEFMDTTLEANGYYHNTCILSGDINVDHPQVSLKKKKQQSEVYKYITGSMEFEDTAPVLDSDQYTVDYKRNTYSSSKDGRQKLDYIFIKQQKKEWIVKKKSAEYYGDQSYSDHLAWNVEISI